MSEKSTGVRSDRDGQRGLKSGGDGPFLSGPGTGRMLQPFSLPKGDGTVVRLADYKQRRNVVLVLHHGNTCPSCRAFLVSLGERLASYAEAESVVLGISVDGREATGELTRALRLPFDLLSDPSALVAAREQLDIPALVIADRFGEVWAAWRAGERHAFPSSAEVGEWLQFVELQCRECEAPEWPSASDEG
jgi:peroxiredoxin